MITDNFKVFIEALEALPEDIKNNEVNMKSVDEPVCVQLSITHFKFNIFTFCNFHFVLLLVYVFHNISPVS
jgi:hypothetical protein